MRQLCNVAWAVQVEAMDEKEFRHFEKELVRDPTRGPASRGTADLMGVFGGGKRPPPPRRKREPVNPDRKAPSAR